MRCFRSESDDPFLHLAWEDVLLDCAETVAPALLLFANRPCVVIGKNQVPWRECATAALRASRTPLARRISGGGTVYHDRGNLNYAFLLPRDTYRQEDVFEIILTALLSLGIKASVGDHNGLFADGRKFSGTAFCYRRQHVLHHGTLLVDTDLDRLRAACVPALPQIETKAISSRPASVVNLRELLPSLTVDALGRTLASAAGTTTLERADLTPYAARADEMRRDEWTYGLTPRFDVMFGGCTLSVDQGHVADVSEPAAAGLIGCPFDRDALLAQKSSNVWKDAAGFFQSLENTPF